MQARHIKDIVLRCLKLAFKVTRIFGMISFSSRSEPCWFRWSTETLEHTQPYNFHFDKPEDYLQIEDTTLSRFSGRLVSQIHVNCSACYLLTASISV
jgi:hypothetical protein